MITEGYQKSDDPKKRLMFEELSVSFLSNIAKCYMNLQLYENSLDYSNKALELGTNFTTRPLYYKAASLAHLMEFD